MREVISVSLILILAVLVRIPSLTQPLGPDQGVLTVIGEGLLNGELPYRDYWEMASPGIFFTYASILKVFGRSMMAIPLADTLVAAITTLLIFVLAKCIFGRIAGYISAVLYAIFSSGVSFGMHSGGDVAFGTFWFVAQRESFMLPLITASIYLVLIAEEGHNRDWLLIASGFLSGLTFVYKFPSLLILVCLFIYINGVLLLERTQRMWKLFLRRNLFLIGGFIGAIIPFIVFFAVKGALSDMIEANFKYVFEIYGKMSEEHTGMIKRGVKNTFFIAKENFILWIFFVTSSLYIALHERNRRGMFMVLWGVASLVIVVMHREFFGYHYLIILPPFCVLAGYGLAKSLGPRVKIGHILKAEHGKVFIALTILANAFIFASLNYKHYTRFFRYVSGSKSQEWYYSHFNAYPKHEYSFPADNQVAKHITEHTKEGDLIYIIGGIEGVIHFLTQRKSPSRFVYSWFLFSTDRSHVAIAERYRKELLADFQRTPPKYIITIKPLETYREFSAIYQFVRSHYILEKSFPDDRYVYLYDEQGS